MPLPALTLHFLGGSSLLRDTSSACAHCLKDFIPSGGFSWKDCDVTKDPGGFGMPSTLYRGWNFLPFNVFVARAAPGLSKLNIWGHTS